MNSSHSVENYIKGIYNLSGEDALWINTNHLAEKMSIKASSVSDMIKKLSQRNLVEYKKYHGVRLTEEGKKLALKVIRKHRLWEVFLHKNLGFAWDEVHEIAEQLEHISSSELVERLNKYLDFPKFDPHGDPIPDEKGKIKKIKRDLLSECKKGDSGKIVGVEDSSAEFLQFLENRGLFLGCRLLVLECYPFDNSMDVEITDTKTFTNLSMTAGKNIYLNKNE